MGLLKKAENTMAYFKAGIFGFQGSGKTYTASLIAKGICDVVGNKKIAFFDTETGSDFMLPKLGGYEVFQVKSRAFSDLCKTIKEAEENQFGILIIDSITHVWRDLMDSYDKKLKRNGRLQFQDWARIKGEWAQYTDIFVNSCLHIIVCGRAGFDYDYSFNEDGTKDLVKTGTKMKAESEFGFEPSLVIQMEAITESREELKKIKNKYNKQAFSPKIGSKLIHRAHVLKDRTDTLNGAVFDYPAFDDFRSHFEYLNIGGDHLGVDTSRNSQDRFDIEGKPDWEKRKVKVNIALEKIKDFANRMWPSPNKKEDKVNRSDFLFYSFSTRSWAEIEGLELEMLEEAVAMLSVLEKHLETMSLKDAIDKIFEDSSKGKQ